MLSAGKSLEASRPNALNGLRPHASMLSGASMELQRIVDLSVAMGDAPFLVAMVCDNDGVRFSGAFGDAAPGRLADETTVFRIFSMSKPYCAVAIMMLIERGLLDPETPVADIVPQFSQIGVLHGYQDGKAILLPPQKRATVRHLATHTSGLEYEFWNPDVADFIEKTGHPSIINGTLQSMCYPMMSEPGTRWGYGPSIDWLGLVVEAIDGRRIDKFCTEEIFEPLGLRNTYFEVDEVVRTQLCAVSARLENGLFSEIAMDPPSHPEVYGMGIALYSTAPDYLRFLRLFLNGGELDGHRILSSASIDAMFADQMDGLSFSRMVSCAPVTADVDPFPGIRHTHTFGFLRNEDDIPGMRFAGSVGWAGVLNSHYWIDRTSNVAAVFMSQSLPFCEPGFMKRYEQFERCVYRQLRPDKRTS
ncbi:Probable 1,4-butanediol diacrylate esterase [Neorhizobium galegae bv. orientalis]|nr:Probable 1,4-butanediol diacrylate esterase [Neorhizobium galegae bv. orientalis]